ncbi:hypothetical protein F4809DRAFT_592193 [Biscogniauxia mediterranea]|nr:hypothetical protein F4809DRAFT_592193 [Biscogniauxia mediterranea]
MVCKLRRSHERDPASLHYSNPIPPRTLSAVLILPPFPLPKKNLSVGLGGAILYLTCSSPRTIAGYTTFAACPLSPTQEGCATSIRASTCRWHAAALTRIFCLTQIAAGRNYGNSTWLLKGAPGGPHEISTLWTCRYHEPPRETWPIHTVFASIRDSVRDGVIPPHPSLSRCPPLFFFTPSLSSLPSRCLR